MTRNQAIVVIADKKINSEESDRRREQYFSQLDDADFLKEEARQRAAIDIQRFSTH